MSKSEGFKHKYIVSRVDRRPIGEALVLEFEDPVNHPAIHAWALTMKQDGYNKVHDDIMKKLVENGLVEAL